MTGALGNLTRINNHKLKDNLREEVNWNLLSGTYVVIFTWHSNQSTRKVLQLSTATCAADRGSQTPTLAVLLHHNHFSPEWTAYFFFNGQLKPRYNDLFLTLVRNYTLFSYLNSFSFLREFFFFFSSCTCLLSLSCASGEAEPPTSRNWLSWIQDDPIPDSDWVAESRGLDSRQRHQKRTLSGNSWQRFPSVREVYKKGWPLCSFCTFSIRSTGRGWSPPGPCPSWGWLCGLRQRTRVLETPWILRHLWASWSEV